VNTDPGGDNELPYILEIIPLDEGHLTLQTSGLIILDADVYNNLNNLNIDAATNVYLGMADLPVDQVLPDILQLNSIAFTGTLSLTGVANDYILLQQFYGDSTLDLTASGGVLVIDTASLTAVPIPGAALLLLSGMAVLLGMASARPGAHA
jgi:hypothetical protein